MCILALAHDERFYNSLKFGEDTLSLEDIWVLSPDIQMHILEIARSKSIFEVANITWQFRISTPIRMGKLVAYEQVCI